MGGSSGKINEAAKAFVDENISNNKVVVFSKSYCPYCKMAKTSLSEVGLDAANYRVLELDQHRSSAYSSGDVQDYLQTISHISTVPQVFIGGKFVADGSKTKAMKQSGELQKILKEVGAL